jgi:hypothetical protein
MSGILGVTNPYGSGANEGLVFPKNRLSKEEILELVAHRAFVGDKPSAIERAWLEFPADVAANMEEAIEKFELSQGVEQLKEQLFDLFYGKPPSFEEPPQNHVIEVLDQTLKGPLVADPLSHPHVLEKILPWCELKDIIELSCVSHSLRQGIIEHLSPETAFKICGSRLRIINTGSAEMPAFSPFELIKVCHTLAPLVEGDAGLTFLIMREGLTLRELVKMAAEKGITVDILGDKILEEIGDISIGQTYGVLITNNVFKDSRSKSYADQEKLVRGAGCEMPTVQESVALCFLTQILGICLYGQNPRTYGRTSTHVGGYPLVVGGSAPSRLDVSPEIGFDDEDCGAGCRRKF